MKNIRLIVIGLGSMGKRRVRNLLANGISKESIRGIDKRKDRRLEAFEKYGIETWNELTSELIDYSDAFVISTPPDQHFFYAQLAVKYNKNMFIEASVLSDGLLELCEKADKDNLVVFPSCTMKFASGPKRIKEIISKDTIGKVLVWQYQSGQYLPDWHPWESISDFYVSNPETGGCREIVPFEMVWLESVFGKVKDVDGRHAKLSNISAPIDDIYMLQIQHKNGIMGQLIVDVIGRTSIRYMRITGTEGTLEWNEDEKKIRVFRVSTGTWQEESIDVGHIEPNYINSEGQYIEEIHEFLECITTGKEPQYTLRDDINNLNILYNVERANKEKKRININ